MIKKRIFFMIIACMIEACVFANSTEQITTVEKVEISKQFLNILQSENEKEREDGASNIKEQYSKLIDGLIEIASKQIEIPKTVQDMEYIQHETKYHSIILLGDLRAAKAVPVLLDNIEYVNPNITVVSGLLEIEHIFISAGALIKIGIPVVEPVLDRLSMVNNDRRKVSVYCEILNKILGSKLVKYRIQITIDETKDETAKKNLGDALSYIETHFSN